MIRRRLDLPRNPEVVIEYPGWYGCYVCLGAGQEKTESFSLTLPVGPSRYSAGPWTNAEYADRLAVEIGFYDEDLPALILRVVEIAEQLGCDLDIGSRDFREIADRFFGGRSIAKAFKHLLGFKESVLSDDDKVTIPHMGQVHLGEKVLQVKIEGVHIPYLDWNFAEPTP